MKYLFITALLLLSAAAFSADEPKPAVVTLTAQDMPLDEAVTEISRQVGVRIIIDSGVTGKVNASFNQLALEQALDVITKTNGLRWQKIYSKENPESKTLLEDLKEQAATLAKLKEITVAVYDPETKSQIILVKQQVSADAPAPVSPETIGLKPFYLITLPKIALPEKKEAAPAESDFAALNQKALETLLNMSPEERQRAFQEQVTQELALPDNMRRQYVMDRVSSIMKMDEGIREQYMRLWGEAFRELHGRGEIGGGFGGGRRGPRGDRE